jgi:putative ATP-dependent endonuclease of OLD family
VASEKKRLKKSEGRPHVLLLEEPEICLHPNAIREACSLLYGLPQNSSWQVMVTTHSPCFVDVSRDNTTIVRVEREAGGRISGTTIFRPSMAQLDADDKRRLKLLNLCDPYVAEFFFGGRTIVVEGDTEYTAFNYVREIMPQEFKDVHIVRARGKATIVSLMKILNHFGKQYAVLHDADRPTATRQGKEITNPAWTKNFDILSEAQKAKGSVTLVASMPNFEGAYFDEELTGEKPYTALTKLREEGKFFKSVYMLLGYLVGSQNALPKNAIAWNKRDDLEAFQS